MIRSTAFHILSRDSVVVFFEGSDRCDQITFNVDANPDRPEGSLSIESVIRLALAWEIEEYSEFEIYKLPSIGYELTYLTIDEGVYRRVYLVAGKDATVLIVDGDETSDYKKAI